MSGVYLSGVIGRLSIYCNLPVLECLSLGKGGSIGLVEYNSIAIVAMALTDNGCCWQGVITCTLVDLGGAAILWQL